MDVEYSERSKALQEQLSAFMDEHIYPIEAEVNAYLAARLFMCEVP